MPDAMEIPTTIRSDLEEKGGLEGVVKQLSDDTEIKRSAKIYAAHVDVQGVVVGVLRRM